MKRNEKDIEERAFAVIKDYIAENGISPTFEEIRRALEVASKSTVYEVMGRLEAAGKISFVHVTENRRGPRCIRVNED